jgi:alpha-amylase
MTTKPQAVPMLRSVYDSAFDAFTNYMNILGDFLKRVNDLFSENVENDELNALYTQIANLGDELTVKENEISVLRARLEKFEVKAEKVEEPAPVKKAPAKKATAKKSAPVKEVVPAPEETPAKKPTAKKATAKKTSEKK